MGDAEFAEALAMVMMLVALPLFLATFLTACLFIAPFWLASKLVARMHQVA